MSEPAAGTGLTGALAGLAPVPVPAEYAPGVAMWLDVLAGHAALFADMPLGDEAEPAPVFRP